MHGRLPKETIVPAAKTARAQERRSVMTQRARSTVRTAVKTANRLLKGGDAKAPQAVLAAIADLDRAAVKGVLHRNNAARHKSALMRALNATKPAKTATEPAKVAAKPAKAAARPTKATAKPAKAAARPAKAAKAAARPAKA